GLRLLEGELPQPTPLGREQLDHGEAKLPLVFPHRRPAEYEDLHPVGGRPGKAAVVLLEHDAAQLRRAVAQREIPVAALPGFESADLAAHREGPVAALVHGPGRPSTATAPGLIISPVTNSGLPIATIRISPCRVMDLMSRVREWHTVTVALPPGPSCSSRAAMGLPTMVDRPTITACRPVVSMSLRSSSCCTPYGV